MLVPSSRRSLLFLLTHNHDSEANLPFHTLAFYFFNHELIKSKHSYAGQPLQIELKPQWGQTETPDERLGQVDHARPSSGGNKLTRSQNGGRTSVRRARSPLMDNGAESVFGGASAR